MAESRPIPADLRAARRRLDGIAGVRLVRDLDWHAAANRWALILEITSNHITHDIPLRTFWWVLLEAHYPQGNITIYPAKDGGITATFAHQNPNYAGLSDCPWRTGDICVRTPHFILGRRAYDQDPVGQSERLAWYVTRAVEWINAAATGTLTMKDDPFELPKFKDHGGLVAFASDSQDFPAWSACSDRWGLVELAMVSKEPRILVVRRFLSHRGEVLQESAWGTWIEDSSAEAIGIWMRLDSVPILPPYLAPRTWAELRKAFSVQHLDLDSLLRPAFSTLRDGKRHHAILGFPVSELMGQAPVQMHWQGMELPTIASGKGFAKGFRNDDQGYWRQDRQQIGNEVEVLWTSCENWAESQLTRRGQLPAHVRKARICLIGAGALGSAIAELLVRGGVRVMTVVDPDIVTAGNLVRHTLTLESADGPKAEWLAWRLCRISPHARIRFIALPVGDAIVRKASELTDHDLVLDCTGSDSAAAVLASLMFPLEVAFWSFSFSYGARLLYGYRVRARSFPFASFEEQTGPWILQDAELARKDGFPQEGTGCWHPVFPARADHVWLLATMAIQQLCESDDVPAPPGRLTVHERSDAVDLVAAKTERTDDPAGS